MTKLSILVFFAVISFLLLLLLLPGGFLFPDPGRGEQEHIKDLYDADEAESKEESKQPAHVANEANDGDLLPSQVELHVGVPQVDVQYDQVRAGVTGNLNRIIKITTLEVICLKASYLSSQESEFRCVDSR